MIQLVRAELNRLLSRRLTLIAAFAVLAIVGLFQLAVADGVSPPSAQEVAAAQQGYEQYRQDWEKNHVQREQECVAAGNPKEACTEPEPTPAAFGLTPPTYSDVALSGVVLTVAFSMLAMYVVAASFIGAEYSTGSLGNWLTFVPRREQVFAAKISALALGSAAVAVLTGLVMVGVSAIITVAVGQPLEHLDWVVATTARGIGLVVFAALIGFCLAMLTRHTVAALGILIGYGLLVLALSIASSIVESIGAFKRWQLETNVQAFLSHGTTFTFYRRLDTAQGASYEPIERTVSFAAGSAYLAVVLVVVVVVTLLVFRRRDVT